MSDKEIGARILVRWKELDGLDVHCGGVGLVVGCPVCGRRY